ncbi:MAG: PAS domain-containing protein [Planctomycetaceae bacterium]
MKSLPVTTVSRIFVLGILVLSTLAACGAWNVYSLVESVNRLVPVEKDNSPRVASAADELPTVDREQRQRAIQAVHDQAWWIVAVLLAGAPIIVALLLSANWLARRELTQRQLTDKRLQERESRLQAILDSEPECIKLLAADGTLIEMNAAGMEMIEVGSASQVIGQRVDALVIPEHREEFQMMTERVFRGESCTLEYEIIGLKGGHRWLDTHASPLRDERGRVIALLGITRDITARKQIDHELRASGARLQLLLDQLPFVLWTTDRELRFTTSLGAALEDLALRPAQVNGLTLFEYFQTDDPDFLPVTKHRLALEGETVEYELEWGGRAYQTHVEPFRDAMGQIVGTLGVALDVTTRKQTSAELLASRERLAALTRQLITAQENERRQVARELHDEIGQVLTAVSWNLHHLKSVCGSETHAELDAGLSLIDRAQTQVRDLSLNLRPPVLDLLGLEAAVRECVEQHRKLTGCDVQLELHLESRLSPELEITCFRVIQSALTNIARHARASQVSVSIRQTDLEVDLTVSDNGVGLDIDSVLQGLEQKESFGILAMQERVQLVGGKLRIDSASAPGVGTSIRVHLPLEIPVRT